MSVQILQVSVQAGRSPGNAALPEIRIAALSVPQRYCGLDRAQRSKEGVA
jgi:hypothetical protein